MPAEGLPTIGVLVARDALDAAVRAGRDALPKETGGILLGFRTPTQVVVTRVIVVADPRSSRTRYLRRRRRAQEQLAAALGDTPAAVGYVGEWHTHPENQRPSGMDVRAVGETARLAGGAIALLVVAFPATGQPQIYARGALRRDEWSMPVLDTVDVVADALTISGDTGDALEREASATTNVDTEEYMRDRGQREPTTVRSRRGVPREEQAARRDDGRRTRADHPRADDRRRQ